VVEIVLLEDRVLRILEIEAVLVVALPDFPDLLDFDPDFDLRDFEPDFDLEFSSCLGSLLLFAH